MVTVREGCQDINACLQYLGPLLNGLPHGRGIVMGKAGSDCQGYRCEANFAHGIYDGLCIATYPNGDRHEGELRGGCKVGQWQYRLAIDSSSSDFVAVHDQADPYDIYPSSAIMTDAKGNKTQLHFDGKTLLRNYDGAIAADDGWSRANRLPVVLEQTDESSAEISQQVASNPSWTYDPLNVDEWTKRHGKRRYPVDNQARALLGKGAFASTFRAVINGKRLAIKLLDLDDLGLPLDEAIHECRLLQSLRHRNIANYEGHHHDSTRGHLHLFIELASFGSFADLIRNSQPANIVIALATEVADALDYIHSNSVIHRDLKPSNILLNQSVAGGALQAKLADFGFAAYCGAGMVSQLSSRVGTSVYFAPERARGRGYDGAADMWALGCVLVEVVTGVELDAPIWDDGPEVSTKREQLVAATSEKIRLLGQQARRLLVLDPAMRMRAMDLRHHLMQKIKPVVTSRHEVPSRGCLPCARIRHFRALNCADVDLKLVISGNPNQTAWMEGGGQIQAGAESAGVSANFGKQFRLRDDHVQRLILAQGKETLVHMQTRSVFVTVLRAADEVLVGDENRQVRGGDGLAFGH